MSHEPVESPLAILETLRAFQASGALRAAIELDIFTWIASGKRRAVELAAGAQASERGVRILCDALAVMGFLVHQDDGYDLTPISQIYLNRNSLFYLGSISSILTHDLMWRTFHNVADAVRRGGSMLELDGLAPDHPFWVEFATALAPAASMTGAQIAEILGAGAPGHEGWRVLDVACGSGFYGFAVAQRDQQAQITSVDWPAVLERTREFARQAGVASRVRYLPGDLFKVDYGDGYDLALLTNIYHHFDKTNCVRLSEKIFRALKPGGRAAILEFIPNDARTGPPAAIMFSLTMLVWTPAGEAYTLADYRSILESAGFAEPVLHDLEHSPHQLLVAHRPR
ncbi:MAG: methyltransferase domain-containing protein [Acidobacteria bacterium]|nr:methyltransferase domain-containing protein [Acidobacteriota bacterium]MBI3657504.1 methyltransferase domain-containing protein [Acidobacteriota bacterium]